MEAVMETVIGKVERIMKSDEKTAFCIARVTPVNEDNVNEKYLSIYGNFSVLGNAYLMEDMEYTFTGEWKKNAYGYTFHFNNAEKRLPNDVDGLFAYIQTFKGIGPTTAKRIIDKFGLETLDVMENKPERLLEVKGITSNKLEKIMENFSRNKGFEELSKFLKVYGISTKKCVQIYEKFGDGSEKKINENPYILCDEIERISFQTSDKIAREMAFPLDHFYRLKAGILHILKEASSSLGHLFLYEDELSKAFNKLFPSIGLIRFEEVLRVMESQELIKRIDDNDKIYLTRMYKMEDFASKKSIKLCGNSYKIKNLAELISETEKENNIKYANMQIKAMEALNCGSSFYIITGGPGTGKSTIIKGVLKILKKDNPKLKVKLAAPTGRASKRMSEATGYEASTIHRMLEYNPFEKGFSRNSHNPLECDVLIIDECSMIDIELYCSLISAIKQGTRVIMLGDIDQLPPVGIGYIFRDLIESQIIKVVRLNEVFRQGEGSVIKLNAANIREGITKLEQRKGSFELICYKKKEDKSDLLQIQEAIISLFKNSYNKEYAKNKNNAIFQIQILSPMRKGSLGVNNINRLIQNVYNPKSNQNEFVFWSKDKTESFIYREGDKVMQIINDYDKNVFNGDLGIISSVDIKEGTLDVVFENNEVVTYDKSEIRENLVLAYASTVHKSQGSEYNVVIVVCSYAHAFMRQRNLYYTAITRAKETVYTVGDLQSIAISIKTVKASIRNSKVKERLSEYKAA